MTIQRQYSLPNCRLVLEGWGDNPGDSSSFMDERPVMTILVNAEFHLVGRDKPLSGGREFLEHLVASVNQYAQQVLSGVPHGVLSAKGKPSLVSLQKVENSLHRLTILQPEGAEGTLTDGRSPDSVIDLSTVQLFDLVEAIDQMVADAQTLPDIFLDLTPVPKRRVSSQEPTASRVVPAALGISGLAIAAIALFYVPTPEYKPADPDAQTTEGPENATPDPTLPGAAPNPNGASDSDANSPTDPAENAPSSDESSSGAPGSSSSSAALTDLPSQDTIDEFFTQATPIADGGQLDALTRQLRDQLVDAWDQPPTFAEELEYRVGMADNGDIVGFKFVNDAALTYVDEVPLLNLTRIPFDADEIGDEPIGQFKVVFRPNGVVEVSPWYGRPQSSAE